ncbi:MAG: FAD-binding oxidoreductase [Vicinamibacteria bacterium]|nr:FAD-binding oxidoreductase [Vicinamibacteria bacterium]
MTLAPPHPELLKRLQAALPANRILSRPIDRLARASDASMYRIVPEVVVRPRDASDVRKILEIARALAQPLTFRAAGTSLSGQAVGGGILVDLSLDWGRFRIEDGGARIWAQPGVIGGLLNRALTPLGRRIGPDPASIDAAMLGGIVANNASGMCCGVSQNSYHTIRGATIVLADGVFIDTHGESRDEVDEQLKNKHPRLHAGLLDLKTRVRADKSLSKRIRHKFTTKNTMGYSLQAFLEFDRPADILTRLMVGSEGTLGFLADITLETVKDPASRATALVYFQDLREAGRAVEPLAEAGASALEIMDSASLLSMADDLVHPVAIGPDSAALLVECQGDNDKALAALVERATRVLKRLEGAAEIGFSTDASGRAAKWKLRKGLFPRVGARRGPGLAVLNEDVAFPRERLADAIADLHALFARFGVRDAVVFGHAKDGNLHFIAPQDFRGEQNVTAYAAFMEGLADLVVGKYDGALKAEHGTGRNMAPFVEREWGEAACSIMREIKALFDPYRILNPGVLLSDDKDEHVKNLKPFTEITDTADRCIECGFCEPVCPTRASGLSPRQRIILLREIKEIAQTGESMPEGLAADFAELARSSCVRDSMCVTACPVKIDTGLLMKELDQAESSFIGKGIAGLAASNFAASAEMARKALSASARLAGGNKIARGVLSGGSALLHAMAPGLMPRVDLKAPFPLPAPAVPAPRGNGNREVVYFPSCVSRIFGALPDEIGPSTMEATLRSLEAASYHVTIPQGVDSLCCGLAFSSKSQEDAAARSMAATRTSLSELSRGGDLLVVTDASPCALAFAERAAPGLRVLDFVQFWAREVLSREDAPKGVLGGRAILHPTCSLTKLGAVDDLRATAAAHAEEAVIPLRAACCGFAGNQGFVRPEITEGATRAEAEDVRALVTANSTAYSSCRTCEIGMTRATGTSYASAAHLVYRALGLPKT